MAYWGFGWRLPSSRGSPILSAILSPNLAFAGTLLWGRVHAHTHTQSQTLLGLCSRCLQTQGTQAGLHGNQHSARRQAGQDSTAVSALAACWNPQGSLHSHQRPGHPEQLIQLVHVGPGFVMFSKLPR